MRPLRVLGKSRKALKFMNAAAEKHLSTSDLHAIMLDSNNAEEHESKEDDSSECSTNEEVVEKDSNSVEDFQKEKKNMMEGCVLDFKEKTFFHGFGMPIKNEDDVDDI